MATWDRDTIADVVAIVSRVASAIDQLVYEGDPIVESWHGDPAMIRDRAACLRSFADELVDVDVDELRSVLGGE